MNHNNLENKDAALAYISERIHDNPTNCLSAVKDQNTGLKYVPNHLTKEEIASAEGIFYFKDADFVLDRTLIIS